MAVVLAAVVLLGAFLSPHPVAAQDILDLESYPRGAVTVQTDRGPHRFDVWIADTPERQRQGLMYVRDLPATQGMLFVNDPPRVSSFWMKNTFIPLDILFFDAQGRLLAVFANTTPLSLEPIGPNRPVRWILELRGGESTRRGITVGDRLQIGQPRPNH